MKFSPADNKKKPSILSLSLDEAYLNKKIIESIFRFFLLSITIFIIGVFFYLLMVEDYSVSLSTLSFVFLSQIVLFVLARYIPQTRLSGVSSLILISFLLGILLMPTLLQVNLEFGQDFIGRSLLVTTLFFGGFAMIGWSNENFMPRLFNFIKYGCLFMIFFSVISPFINWKNQYELMFAVGGIILISFIILFDFQKLRYYYLIIKQIL